MIVQPARKKLCFLVNPIAGMGGAVGLKGTDGLLDEARLRGAEPVSPKRARVALMALWGIDALFLTGSGDLGEQILDECGLPHLVVHRSKDKSDAEDTKALCRECVARGVELILFCGGDGTARDVAAAAGDVPMLGIPAGVKMHSGVFAVSPQAAADLAKAYINDQIKVKETEIVDVDEEKYREGVLETKIYAIANTPYKPVLVQERKQIYQSDSEEEFKREIAIFAKEFMRDGSYYIVGAGSTTAKIALLLGREKTLLGVDVYQNGELICRDASEKDLLSLLSHTESAKIIISPIGAQGFILGRGSQQISANVLRRVGAKNLIIVATPHKLKEIPYLLVDTGEPEMDREIAGKRQVVTGYRIAQLKEVIPASDIHLDISS
jgi:predicted polyphosphate/ATP-dependent NAD kinase